MECKFAPRLSGHQQPSTQTGWEELEEEEVEKFEVEEEDVDEEEEEKEEAEEEEEVEEEEEKGKYEEEEDSGEAQAEGTSRWPKVQAWPSVWGEGQEVGQSGLTGLWDLQGAGRGLRVRYIRPGADSGECGLWGS